MRLLLAALSGAASAAPRALSAQGSTGVVVSATIDNTALTAQSAQNLHFGTVIPGTPLTIAPTNTTSAGMIRIQGAKKATVIISFTLPTQLRTGGTGPYTMPISFSATSACEQPVFPVGSACTPFNPATGVTTTIPNKAFPSNEIDVYLGGTVSPSPTQHGGVYDGTITLTVIY